MHCRHVILGWLGLLAGLQIISETRVCEAATSAAGQTTAAVARVQLTASPETGWPQWRGPRRDGVCTETNLLQQWPGEGPRLLWKSSGLGRGYSAPIITGGRIYLTGDVGDELRVYALDVQGKLLWETKNGRSWKIPYPGARSCCTFSEGRLYLMNAHGRLACLDAGNGAEIWAADMLDRFGGKTPTWGLSECLLVYESQVIATPAGAKALMVSLDKRTGSTLWTTEPLKLGASGHPAQQRLAEPAGETDSASYTSPIMIERDGQRQIVNCSLRHMFGVEAKTGKLLWTYPLPTQYGVIAATPTLVNDAVLMTAPDTEAGRLIRPAWDTQPPHDRIECVWSTRLDTCHGCLVCVEGVLYGSWYRKDKGWASVDAATGQVRHHLADMAMGSILYADGRLYCLSQEGEMALIKPTSAGWEYAGRFRLVAGRDKDVWTHPVIGDKKLYLRYHETLFCYDIQNQP